MWGVFWGVFVHLRQSCLLGDRDNVQKSDLRWREDNESTGYVDIPHLQTNESYLRVKTTPPPNYAPTKLAVIQQISKAEHSKAKTRATLEGVCTGASPHLS